MEKINDVILNALNPANKEKFQTLNRDQKKLITLSMLEDGILTYNVGRG